MSHADDYVAVDPTGKKLGGPFKDYSQAKALADQSNGYVTFVSEMAKEGHRASDFPSRQEALKHAYAQGARLTDTAHVYAPIGEGKFLKRHLFDLGAGFHLELKGQIVTKPNHPVEKINADGTTAKTCCVDCGMSANESCGCAASDGEKFGVVIDVRPRVYKWGREGVTNDMVGKPSGGVEYQAAPSIRELGKLHGSPLGRDGSTEEEAIADLLARMNREERHYDPSFNVTRRQVDVVERRDPMKLAGGNWAGEVRDAYVPGAGGQHAAETFTVKTARAVNKTERMRLEEEIGMKGTVVRTEPDGRVFLKWRVGDAQWAARIRSTLEHSAVGTSPAFDPFTGVAREAASEQVIRDPYHPFAPMPYDVHPFEAVAVVQRETIEVETAVIAAEGRAAGAGSGRKDLDLYWYEERGYRFGVPRGAYAIYNWTARLTQSGSVWRLEIEEGGAPRTTKWHWKRRDAGVHDSQSKAEQVAQMEWLLYLQSHQQADIGSIGAGETARVLYEEKGKARTDFKPLKWKRTDDGGYTAQGGLGTYTIGRRPPKRREGVFPVVLFLNRGGAGSYPLRDFDSVGEAKTFADTYEIIAPSLLASPGVAAPAPVGTCGPFAYIHRDTKAFAACRRLAEQIGPIDSIDDVWKLIAPELTKFDQEVFLVVPLGHHGEVREVPINVSLGQRARVTVDPSDVIRAVALAGASEYWVVHGHPSGHSAAPSPADMELTKVLRKSADAAFGRTKDTKPTVEFLGHAVITGKEVGDASNGKVVRMA